MLPSVEQWLSDSWADYRRRFWTVMSVIAVGGLVTGAAVFLPLLPAGLATAFEFGSPWLVWGATFAVSLLAGLWFSTWAQAALLIAAGTDASADKSLREGWRLTPAFAWVISLAMLAVGGGFIALILPGLILSSLLFLAPFYQLDGEERGLGALELSCARVRPLFGAVSGRLALAALIACLPSWIPWIGWLIGPLWAPFSLVACSRLAADLKTAAPSPDRPSLRIPVAVLSALFVGTCLASTYQAARRARAVGEAYAQGRLTLPPPDALTAQSLAALLQGQATQDDVQRSATYVISLSTSIGKTP